MNARHCGRLQAKLKDRYRAVGPNPCRFAGAIGDRAACKGRVDETPVLTPNRS